MLLFSKRQMFSYLRFCSCFVMRVLFVASSVSHNLWLFGKPQCTPTCRLLVRTEWGIEVSIFILHLILCSGSILLI